MNSKSDKAKASYLSVGRVARAQGLKGEVYVTLGAPNPEWAGSLLQFQLQEPSGLVATFTVEKIRIYKHGLIIKPKEVTDRTQAEKLTGHLFLIPTETLVSREGEAPYLREILGFKVIYSAPEMPSTWREIGTIVDFSFNGAQDLLVIETSRGRVEVPFVREFVSDVDYQNGAISLRCPLELLDPEFWKV